jgi:hypothetical protein
LTLLWIHKNYRVYPAFALYILLNMVLGTLAFVIYNRWGFLSESSWRMAWVLQALALCARGVAVAEVCKHMLSRYRGVWALAWRVQLASGFLVLLYSGFAARRGLEFILPKAARGLEMAIATVIVAVFLFVRYYGVEAKAADRTLAIGFCFYSCFSVLNNTVLERFLEGYVPLWNVLGMSAFLASLILWSLALWQRQAEMVPEETLLPMGVYQSLTPQINLRLRSLNDQLWEIWSPKVSRH